MLRRFCLCETLTSERKRKAIFGLTDSAALIPKFLLAGFMTKMKSLAKQTAVYGLSNMLGKFLNWCLVPLYTYVLTNSAEYGVVTNLYAWTALLLVILTYGMETGFFRFANKEGLEPKKVYSTILWCVFGTSVLFACAGVLFSDGIAGVLGYSAHPEYVSIMCVIVAMDAFGCIPFAYLRYENKALRFALLKLLMILVNIGFNLFFLVACPKIMETAPGVIDWFYKPDYGVGYVFVSNLFSTIFVTLMLTPQICKAGFSFDKALLRTVLKYSLPLLVLGVAGIMNQTIDKIIFPYLLPDRAEADAQLGIYGACFKVAMVMMVFTQAFRYAYEPFVFAQNKGGDKKKEYSDAMKFFIIFSWLIFLGMVFYIDILKFVIRSDYWEGLRVIPIILVSYLLQGVFFNLSLWYKLTDKTQYGAYLSLIGLCVILSVNVIFVPKYGYMASAFASMACYFVVVVLSYILGQKYYPVRYDLKSAALYSIVAIAMYIVSQTYSDCNVWLKYIGNTILMILYVVIIVKRDLPLKALLRR